MEKIEYRVRPVTRYIVTRFHEGEYCRGVSTIGEYDNADVAYQVGYACCKAEHDRLGWPADDMRIQYPRKPISSAQIGSAPAMEALSV